MARAAAAAQVEERMWSLSFENGSTRRLRVGGFFAGHDSKEDLKNELYRLFMKQEQFEEGENHDLELEPLVKSDSNTNAVLVKANKKRKARSLPLREVPDQDLPVCFATRSAQRAADAKRKLAATEKRRRILAEKKRKLADDKKLYVLGVRKTVTRFSHV